MDSINTPSPHDGDVPQAIPSTHSFKEEEQEVDAPRLSLAQRMKSYESPFDFTLPPNEPIILRLDGHNFSRFTAPFSRPFDTRIHSAMISAASDLLSFFPAASLVYTFSDEITLVFPTGIESFNARVQKLASLGASFCATRFNASLIEAMEKNTEENVGQAVHDRLGTALFDARFFTVPSLAEALNCLIWRCRNDAVRNAVSGFARTMFSPKQMHGKKTNELLEMMEKEKSVKFEESVPRWAREGCLIKREKVRHEGVNGKTGEVEVTWRTRVRVEERGVREFREEGLRLVTERYW